MGDIVITGAAGFIGSCMVTKLNERGRADLIVVDHYGSNGEDAKQANLKDKKYKRYFDKKDFIDVIRQGLLTEKVEYVLHIGACSSTILQDQKYFQENNFEYSCVMAEWAMKHNARFIYASSAATYGDGSQGYKDDDASTRACRALNLYGESKQKFDSWILDRGWQDRVVGLKFFNVFGPNEYHKGEMRSVVAKAYDRVVAEGKIALFKSYTKDYADGDQMRDFIYVKDVVDIITFFMDHPKINGIFNVGTGQARTWNDLARAIFAAVGKEPQIEYIDMPPILRDKYQNFTQADISKLRKVGYAKPLTTLEAAVKDYAGYLANHRYW
jgi:ADP-L-glycero-D-manno-heptose 6-epimerase